VISGCALICLGATTTSLIGTKTEEEVSVDAVAFKKKRETIICIRRDIDSSVVFESHPFRGFEKTDGEATTVPYLAHNIEGQPSLGGLRHQLLFLLIQRVGVFVSLSSSNVSLQNGGDFETKNIILRTIHIEKQYVREYQHVLGRSGLSPRYGIS